MSAQPVRQTRALTPTLLRTSTADRLTKLAPSPDFWGPVSNFGIPIAAVMDTQKDPEMYLPSLPPFHPSKQNPPQLSPIPRERAVPLKSPPATLV